MEVGRSLTRVDAYDKVTGRAKYTDDLCPNPCLVTKICHATIANGVVTSIDTSQAEQVPGVVAVFTCFDVPDIPFMTAGHPWSLDPGHRDIADRHLLEKRVRMYGDNIACVVADDEVAATRGVNALKVEYEEYPVSLTADRALAAEGTDVIHDEHPDNIIGRMDLRSNMDDVDGYDSVEDVFADENYHHAIIEMDTPRQSQVHIEGCLSYCYMENDRIVCVSSTQIPHIVRRVISQALGIDYGQVRVIKPYIGGGFGNKQDALFEPLNAWVCQQLGGRAVKLELSREEVFYDTRSRQPKHFKVEAAWDDDMNLKARAIEAYSNQGAYASHGHALVANSVNTFRDLYDGQELGTRSKAVTFYSNEPCAGAMRAYGVPEGNWAAECLMGDIAHDMGWDGLEFRLKNFMPQGYKDEFWPGDLVCYSNGIDGCVEKAKKDFGWDERKAELAKMDNTGPIRHGLGCSFFIYKTAVADLSLENATARMTLAQDGSVSMQLGGTEIGQGADTVFCQMAAQAIGIHTEDVHITSTQDTDISPYDPGAYASRQTYVTGSAIKKVGAELKEKILAYVHEIKPSDEPYTLEDGVIRDMDGKEVISLAEVATTAYYSKSHSDQINACGTINMHDNTFSMGMCLSEVTVDIPLCKVTVDKLVQVHDSGTLINPKTAEQQVHGGMAQSAGMALSEELLTDPQTGRILNGNLLDYKIPTTMDLPDLKADFFETSDPTGPFGNKALGEPPCIPTATSIRDAILDATGVKFYQAPMTPQRLFEGFKKAGLI